MEQLQQSFQFLNRRGWKIPLLIIGYFLFGTIWATFNGNPILPLGLIIGLIKIYQYSEKDKTDFPWKYLGWAIVIGALLGSGIIPGVHINVFTLSLNNII